MGPLSIGKKAVLAAEWLLPVLAIAVAVKIHDRMRPALARCVSGRPWWVCIEGLMEPATAPCGCKITYAINASQLLRGDIFARVVSRTGSAICSFCK